MSSGDAVAVREEDLLVELLAQITVSVIRNTHRRWRGRRPSERLIEKMLERDLLEQIEAKDIARLLGTADYTRVS